MATILEQIVEAKKGEVEEQKGRVSQSELEERVKAMSLPLNLSGALLGDRVRLIAEVKKASPSRGLLAEDFDPKTLAQTYVDNGAAAISVLTDPRFQGTLEDLETVAQVAGPSRTPVIRKDFIFDPYQVYEARSSGADGLLLIVAILSPSHLSEMLSVCQELWIQALVEVHGEGELEAAVEAGAEVIGINNRNLHTFETNLSVTERLAGRVPRGKIIVSESGIFTADHVSKVGRLGVNAVLVGEALVTASDTAAKVRELALGEVV